MALVYYRKMIRGDGYRIQQVNERWRPEVEKLLADNGYVINPDGTASKASE